ncbi:MAG: response regulator transcription factor [Ilumatobacteraceae bacterium]|nr:response regulator transcription factor [Actinomycetota bacterium]
MSVTVLVVEDEVKIRDLVRRYLEREDLAVVTTGSGAEAMSILERGGIDLLVLDLNLPDVAGETIAAEFAGRLPIVMLTAKSGEADRIHGLELGADDYLTKPFSPRELVLRVQAVLRRSAMSTVDMSVTSFGGGQLVIDEVRHEATVSGAVVELTPTEWSLLTVLASSPGRVFSRSELVNRVRGYEFDGYERTVDSHIKNLRRKIEPDPHDPTVVETVLGAGYRLGLARDRA